MRLAMLVAGSGAALMMIGLMAFVPPPAAAAGLTFGGILTGLDCVDASTCYAVGTTLGHSALLTYDRPTLAITSIHYLPSTMVDISCGSTHVCYAAGVDAAPNSPYGEVPPHVVVAKIVDGVTQQTKVLAAQMHVNRISCGSATHCLVVGDTTVPSGSSSVNTAGLALWLHGTAPKAQLAGSDVFDGVSCYTAQACLTSGYNEYGDNEDGYVTNYTVDSFVEGSGERRYAETAIGYAAISCVPSSSAAVCEIAGTVGGDSAVSRFETDKRAISLTDTGQIGSFYDVSCVNATVCEAGGTVAATAASGFRTGAIAARFTNTSQTSSTTYLSPQTSEYRKFSRVSCGGSAPCVAIDVTGGQNGTASSLTPIG